MYAYNNNKSYIQIFKIKLYKITKIKSARKGQKKIKRVAKDKENSYKKSPTFTSKASDTLL